MKVMQILMPFAVIWGLAVAHPVEARVFPGGGGGGSGARSAVANSGIAAAAANRIQNPKYGNYGDWGGGTVYHFNNGMVGSLPQRQESAQSLMMQSGIRNTLLTQGQSRTQAIADQRQSYRDWWFETQQQQSANQPRPVGFEWAANEPPKAAMDIIKWPPLLRDPAFASRRTLIEAPYRRTPPELSAPTSQDYAEMISTVQEMKDILEWLTRDGVDTQEYEQAKAFLNKIQQEARQRAQAASKLSEPKG
jgi:hypothetical protein